GAAGTPHYMAPEQAGSDPLGPAADWYAVGVMLHQALTGALPFDGDAVQILGRKLTEDPPRPSERVHGVPDHLDRLCVDLLQREPERRASGKEVIERLSWDASARLPDLAARSAADFVGRALELATLREGASLTRSGRTAAVLVRGLSGMGKSALA